MAIKSIRARENQRKYQKEWQQRNRIRLNEKSRERLKNFQDNHGFSYTTHLTRKYKMEIFAFLLNRCTKCRILDKRLLQIHHVNGGGTKERNGLDYLTYYRKILRELQNGSKEYQLLCANCHILVDLEGYYL